MDDHGNARRLAVVVLIALLALCPQAGHAGAQEEDSVRLTFELYLSGDVPEGELFRLEFLAPPRRSGGSGTPLLYLCGGPRGEIEGPFGPPSVRGSRGTIHGWQGRTEGCHGDVPVLPRSGGGPAGDRPNIAEVFSEGTLRLEEDAMP